MLADGPDHSNMMAKEVWTGTTYALAAAMLQVVRMNATATSELT